MKKTILSLLLLLAISLQAQELTISPSFMNKEARLRYSFTVFSLNDKEAASDIAKTMERLLANKELDVEYTSVLDTTLVDVVFYFDGNNLSYKEHLLKGVSITQLAKKGVELIEKKFYSGRRPSYSTVFSGEDGLYAEYRIPSVSVLPSGRIIAFIEAREGHKDQSENDILIRYSDDMGKTWSSSVVVDQQGESSLNNACVVYIAERNQLLVMYQSFPPKSSEASNFTAGEQLKTFTITSNDGGETWGNRKDVSAQVLYPDMKTICSGPGIAIRSTEGPDKGRILVPFNANGGGKWLNYVAYSDDLGDSWKITKGHTGYGANESQIVQTGSTEYLINARSHRFVGVNTLDAPSDWNPWNFQNVTRNRVNTRLTLSGDDEQWGATEVQLNQPDPTSQGSVLRISGLGIGKKDAKSRILLSNPASQHTIFDGRPYANTPPRRINGTVKISYDEGKTWAYEKRIYGNRFTEYQYSVLVNLGNGKVGCLFEAYPEVRFAVFDVEWLTEGKDKF